MKQSQKDIIREKLFKDGEVNNLECINSGIWRLSDIILNLRREGLEIETIYQPEISKVCKYKLIPKETLF